MQLCAEQSDRVCPQHSPGGRSGRVQVQQHISAYCKLNASFWKLFNMAAQNEHLKMNKKQHTFAPCFCSTSSISLWALSAATCKGVIKLEDTTDRVWSLFSVCCHYFFSVSHLMCWDTLLTVSLVGIFQNSKTVRCELTLCSSHWCWRPYAATTQSPASSWGEGRPQHSAKTDSNTGIKNQQPWEMFYLTENHLN